MTGTRPAAAGLFFWLATAAAADPAPDGKAIAEARCNSCHPLARAASGYTPQGWDTVLRMMQNHGVVIPTSELAVLRGYLVGTCPERAKPPAQIRSGPITLSMTQWQVPTPGSRPHDPLAA